MKRIMLKLVKNPVVIVVIAIAIAGAFIASRKPPEKNETVKKPFLVNASPVQKQDLNFVVKSQGTVLPKVQTILSAQVTGKVVEVSPTFIEGGMFKQGDILVQLEKADYITDLKAAEAELARSVAALEEEQARGKVAAEEYKSISQSVAPELGLRKPQLAKEKANVAAAGANVERAKRNLERTTIRAPYDGLVKSKQVDLGQFVGTGSQLGTVYGTDVAEVRMPLNDNDLAFLELPDSNGVPTEANVTLSARVAGKHTQWKGALVRNEGVVDQQSRVVYTVVEIDDPYKRDFGAKGIPLKFGRFVQTEIIGNRGEGLVVLPRNSLRMDGTVITVDEQRKLRIKEVDVQRADEHQVYISGGLDEGDMVTTSVIPNPVEGMTVRLPEDATQPEGESATELAIAKE